MWERDYEIKRLSISSRGIIKDTTKSTTEQTGYLFTGTAGVSPASIMKFRVQALACVATRQQPKGWTLNCLCVAGGTPAIPVLRFRVTVRRLDCNRRNILISY